MGREAFEMFLFEKHYNDKDGRDAEAKEESLEGNNRNIYPQTSRGIEL